MHTFNNFWGHLEMITQLGW